MNSHQILIQCYGIQTQLALLRLSQIEAEGKEYEAPWLKNSGKVMRDASGRFYSNAKESVGDAVTGVQEVTDDLVQGLLGDESFLKRAGLQAGQFGGEIVKAIQNAPAETVKALEEASASVQKSILNKYEEVNELFAKSVREAKIPEPPADAPFYEKFRHQAAVLNALQENIRETDDFKGALKTLGQLTKAALPIVGTMAYFGIVGAVSAGVFAVAGGVPAAGVLLAMAKSVKPVSIALASAALTLEAQIVELGLDKLGVEGRSARFTAHFLGAVTLAKTSASWGKIIEGGMLVPSQIIRLRGILTAIKLAFSPSRLAKEREKKESEGDKEKEADLSRQTNP